jgi:hypothetical protein
MKKISTGLGIVVILIVSITIGIFIWLYDKVQNGTENHRAYSIVKKTEILPTNHAENASLDNQSDKSACIIYKSNVLGIQFCSLGDVEKIKEIDNTIYFDDDERGEVIKVFDKKINESLYDAINRLILKYGNNPKDCNIISVGADYTMGAEITENNTYSNIQKYVIVSRSAKSTYQPTESEINDYLNEHNWEQDFRDRAIFDLISAQSNKESMKCSIYNEEPGLFHEFIYFPNISKNKFIFMTDYDDVSQPFYDENSVKFIEN